MGGSEDTGARERERGPPSGRAVALERPAAGAYGTRAVRVLARHPDVGAALLLAAFVLLYLWPVLVGGRALTPLTALYAFDPWRHVIPPDIDEHYNPVLVDVPIALYPWRWLVRDLLHHGIFPAWNAHALGGVPLYANPQTGLFSPFALPLWVLPLRLGIGVAAALRLWVGGFGAYLLARELDVRPAAAILAGVSFAFGAFDIVWLTHETLPAVAVMLPWVLWLSERTLHGGRLWPALGLAVAIALVHGGGHPGTQVHVLLIAGLYASLRAALMRDVPGAERLRALAIVGGAVAVGTLLMAFALLPELLSARGTVGVEARSHGGMLPGSHMSLGAIRTVAFPDWWGRPSALQVTTEATLANYNERTFYAGAVALLLAIVALLRRDARRRRAPFAVLAAIGLAVPLHAPGLYWLATHLPILEQVQSQRLHLAFGLAVAVLAACGLQDVLERPRAIRGRLLVPAVALAAAVAAGAAADLRPGDLGRTVRHFLSGADYPGAGVLALTSVTWFALFALALGAGLVLAWRWPARRALVAGGLVLLAMADGYHFAHGYQPMPRAATAVPPTTPAVAYLQRHARGSRIVGLETTLVNDWSSTYGLDDVRGYDPPYPTQRVDRLWRVAIPGQVPWRPYLIDDLDGPAVRLVSVLGARYVVTPPEVTSLPPPPVPLRPLQRVYAGEDAAVYANPNAVPRAMVPSTVVAAAGETGVLSALGDPGFDPLRTAVVERDRPGVRAVAGRRARGTVTIVGQGNARVAMRATLDRTALVVLDDTWMSGWTVRVDGRPARGLPVNQAMRGVVVGRGSHEIVWSYEVPGLRIGALVSAATLAAMLLATGVALRARRSGRAPAAR